PKKVSEALKHRGWIDAMQEELNQFYRNKEDGIDYDETFAPVVRMEAIRIFLAFATYMNFKVYQIDVKSASLNALISKDTQTQTMLVVIWIEKAPQVPVKYLVENWFVELNKKRGGLSKSEVIKEDTKEEVKDEDKDEESTRKRKLGTRKKMKSRKRRYIQHTSEDDSDKENDDLRLYLTIAQDEDKEVDYEILDRKYPIIDWKTECFGTKPQPDEAKSIEEINLNVVTRSNGQQRHFSVLTSVLSIFDREDLNAVYQLVMNKYQDEMPEGFERVLWGDLMVLFNPDEQDEFWSSQHEWKIISWKLHNSSGVHTLMTNEGVVIHMLTEKKYPLKKEILVQMLNLRLESEEESTMALELIRFIKKVLADLESKEQD
ncbi:ribonuclease H-like domain-containing protein, partial [Tanacetum coccineum]